MVLYTGNPVEQMQSNGHKKWQVTYIAPLNHLPLLPSGPGGVQQELAV
jgi:hypothetical protein